MELHNLNFIGSRRPKVRLGRGQGTGKGGTATKGHKGQKSRSGYSKKIGFEGGQMPLQRRVPKFGFKNINRVEYIALNVEEISKWLEENLIKDQLTLQNIVELKRIQRGKRVKVLGKGELKAGLKIEAHAFSASAKEQITKNGGEAIVIK